MLDVKPFEQTKGYCGPACLKMIAEHHGLIKTELQLARLAESNRRTGTPAHKLIMAAKKLGFTARIHDNATLHDIRHYIHKQKTPIIVDWFSPFGTPDGHYSVIVDIDRTHVYLQDPEIGGLRQLELRIFLRLWFDFKEDYITKKSDLILRRLIIIEKQKTTR